MANSTHFGSLGIVKKMFGDKEVLKEVCNGVTVYEKESKEYFLTISNTGAFSFRMTNNIRYWDGTIEYSTDKVNWTTWTGTSTLSAVLDNGTYYLYLRGTGNTLISGSNVQSGARGTFYISASGSNVKISGDMMCLLDWQKFKNHENITISNYAFSYLFGGNNNTGIKDISELTISATTASNYMCYYMFQGCTALTTINPELLSSITTLATYCYGNMFYGCSFLTNCCRLPASTTVNANSCYRGMFNGCSRLVELPYLPSKYLSNSCYNRMFNGCSLIKLSTTQTGTYTNEWRIPTTGTISAFETGWSTSMLSGTGGSFTSDTVYNTTYYTSNTVI